MNARLIPLLLLSGLAAAQSPPDLRVGAAFHAFEHLYDYGKQAEAAAACGATVIYATGLGSDGYTGLPAPEEWAAHLADSRAYAAHAKNLGILTVLGYLCATSIVGLDTFDAHWTPELRAECGTAPASWLQQDANGDPLPSWYGGDYRPACMNNPGWLAYQRFMVRAQIGSGHDGIFFDNPTVHMDGCYCPHCMEKFAGFLRAAGVEVAENSTNALRVLAKERPKDFLRFRATTGRDFLAAMREQARLLNPHAVVTANNSLNNTAVLFSQCHTYGYCIPEMARAEDFVVIEDMGAQPRMLSNGKTAECGPTYAQLHGIIHGKPLVAVTIADNDYHTPPNLVRLAMIEAAAHKTVYMLWSTWPEEQRPGMIAAVRPYADWLRSHTELLENSRPRNDVTLFLPFRRWVETKECAVSGIAAALTRANVQYEVVDEEKLPAALDHAGVLLAESPEVFSESERKRLPAFGAAGGRFVNASAKNWLDGLREAVAAPALALDAPPTVRGVVRDTDTQTVLFLYNLHAERLSSFEDRVTPAENLTARVRVPFSSVGSVALSSVDPETVSGPVPHEIEHGAGGTLVTVRIPRLHTGMMLIIGKE